MFTSRHLGADNPLNPYAAQWLQAQFITWIGKIHLRKPIILEEAMATSWDFRRGKKKWPGSFSAFSCSSPCSERKQCGWCHLTYHYSSHLLITTPEGKWNLLFGVYDLLATRFNKYAYWSGRKVAYDPQGLRTCKGKMKKKGTLYKCRYVRKGMAKEFESCPPGGRHHSWKLSCGIWANRKRPCCFP